MPNDTADWATTFAQFSTTVTVPNGAAQTTATLPIPGGAQAVTLAVLTTGVTALSVTGHQSGAPYLPAIAPPQGDITLTLYDSRDTSIDIVLGHVSTNPADTVDVSFFGAQVVDVADRQGRLLGKVSQLSFDWTAQGTFSGGAASISSGVPPAGQSVVVVAYACRGLLTAAGTFANDLTWSDGTTTLWRDGVAMNTQDVPDHARQTGLGLEGAVGAAVTMASTVNPGATVTLSLAMGGYFE